MFFNITPGLKYIFYILKEDAELVEGELDYSEDDFGKFKQEMENV